RIARLGQRDATQARLVFTGLQQRLLSSVAAFAKTLKVHRRTLERIHDEANRRAMAAVASAADDAEDVDDEEAEAAAEQRVDADEEALAEEATLLGSAGLTAEALKDELAAVEAMLSVADAAARRPDARVQWLARWIAENLLDGRTWRDRRLIIFTEYEDTRRWLEKRLKEAIAHTDDPEQRVEIFSGATSVERRERIKQAFNADPAEEPVRILLCTDAAREGINLQTRCYDLVHFDLPWNPARLEQRNGRIDRKLQPAKRVFCRYFRYAQRPEDIVLEALVRKTETIQRQLGSTGQVIAERIEREPTSGGIRRRDAARLATLIAETTDDARAALARQELDDEEARRRARGRDEIDRLRKQLERARTRVGVAPHELRHVVSIALGRAAFPLDGAKREAVGAVETFAIDPKHPAFAKDAGWQDALDDLRPRRRARRESLNEWRRRVPPRAVAFEPPVMDDGRDADHVVQVHLEHRLVRRLLGRFLSQGFQEGLQRAAVILGPGAQPRVVLLGRVALYGPGAARLHEEILPVTAIWSEAARGQKPLRVLGERGQATTLDQLQDALMGGRRPHQGVVDRVLTYVRQDVTDLLPTLETEAAAAIDRAKVELAKRGEEESRSLRELLERQKKRIEEADRTFDDRQRELFEANEAERRQLQADRNHWRRRLERLEREIREEPVRVREGYGVRAERLEPVGIVYLWPVTG
ncbi:MAG: helicase-related protein, partial [Roseicyclus sp.]